MSPRAILLLSDLFNVLSPSSFDSFPDLLWCGSVLFESAGATLLVLAQSDLFPWIGTMMRGHPVGHFRTTFRTLDHLSLSSP